KVVSSVLKDFNKNLIEIYLTGIIDNLHNAQENVGDIMKREEHVNKQFSNYLLNPLNDYPILFTDALVNSLGANNDVTNLMHTYNNTLLSSDSSVFNINTNNSASKIVQDQSGIFSEHISTMEKTLEEYKSQKESIKLNDYISQLKQMDNQLKQQNDSDQQSKDEYKKTYENNLKQIKDDIKKEKSPFTDEMIDDYRDRLTKSINSQLDNNKELNDALKQTNEDNQKVQDTMINNLRNAIENDGTGQDQFYIFNLSNKDLENVGLTQKSVEEYQEILSDVEKFKNEFKKTHPNEMIKQDEYHGELSADNTYKLTSEGVSIKREETINSKDINQLTIATDPNFNFEGNVYINDKKYDIKNEDINLDTTHKSYKVKVNGIAKLKEDNKSQSAFLKNKTMHLQLLFGQTNKVVQAANEGYENQQKSASVVDLSINHNLEGQLINADIKQQLKSLERFKAQYNIYEDLNLQPTNEKFDNKAITSLMVNEVINDMKHFKTDKKNLLNQVDGLDNLSDDMVNDIFNNKNEINKNRDEISSLITNLEQTEMKLDKNPSEPKINTDKEEEFTTLSTNLDKDISQLSERSTKLLSDSQESKSISESISGKLNQLDDNVNKLHASGKSLGSRANDLNKEMTDNDKNNLLFAKGFAKVLENSKDGDRQNEALKSFMSNPINKKNLENVLAKEQQNDTVSPTVLVLLMYLIAMMTAYIIYTYEHSKGSLELIKKDFSKNNNLWNSIINSSIITVIGIVEGLIIGIIALNQYSVLSGYKMKFIFMVIITMVVFVLINSYLLRQLRSLGMFIMITVLAIYFIAMNSMSSFSNGNLINKLSPLSQIDTMMFNYLNAEHPFTTSLIILSILAIIGYLLNIFIKQFKKERLT
ncbi:type VII secretion protein EsaA, partial [Staphylococcus sp. 231237_7MaSpsaltlick]